MGASADSDSVRRIVLIGAECTGKSTLAKVLSSTIGEPWSREYVRLLVDHLNRPLEERDLEPIARGQIGLEDEAYESATHFAIHDTNLLSSIVYSGYYYSRRVAWVDEAFEARQYWRYFLCQPDFPWEADAGQRESADVRERLQEEFVSTLEGRGIAYTSLSGSLEERLETVLGVCGIGSSSTRS